MCGISALFASHAHFQGDLIRSMSSIIKHRGPDDEGYYLYSVDEKSSIYGGEDTPASTYQSAYPYCPKKNIDQAAEQRYLAALGHRRLSILDLSPGGHQPMRSADGALWITYNGEIYNYLEVREKLIRLGCVFYSQSDTEVILQAYNAWGADCLQHFNGMFAFVIFDERKRSIFAARDRFGVKPLYYWRSPNGVLCFASEIKQFTVLPGWDALLNAQRGYDFLNWGLLDHTHETMFKDVFQLRGGEYLTINLNLASYASLEPVRWYRLRAAPFKGSFEDASHQFRHLLQDSIRLRLRSDVPVGSCLSGGLDSSSIVCLASELLGRDNNQQTFSACSEHRRFDEREHIEHVVDRTNVQSHYTFPDVDQLMEDASSILWHQDEPYPTTSIYAQWQVFKLAKEKNVKVMLDGQGADEQLGGYQGFFGNRVYDLFAQLKWRSLLKEVRAIKRRHPHLYPWPLLLNKLVPDVVRQPIRRMLGKSASGPHWLDMQLLGILDRHPCKKNRDKTLYDQSMQQLKQTSLPMLLHFEDRDSMAHSVESRTPFLDYRLVEFNLGLPSEYKVSDGWTKHVMRRGLDQVLPAEVCWRADKMGFVTAEEEWVCRERPIEFEHLFERAMDSAQGIFKPSARVQALDMIQGRKPYSSLVWRQITFAQWMDLFHCSF